MKNNRCRFLMLTMCILLCAAGLSQSNSIFPERHGDHLIVAAPQLHFISGKAVERLQNGLTITYVLTLTVTSEHSSKQTFQLREKCAVSYDLWEEKYSVARITDGRTASRLTPGMAEAWCLENMPIPIRSIPERQPFMIKLECSIEEKNERENGETSSLTLPRLVEIFSRKRQETPLRWEAADGPFRLEELKVGSRQ